MASMLRLLLLFLMTVFAGQSWGLAVTPHDNYQYDVINVVLTKQNYVYDTTSKTRCSGIEQSAEPCGEKSIGGANLAFIDGLFVPKATDLPVVKPGTKEWKEAVDSMRRLGKGKLNVRTETATDALALLKEARGNMSRFKNYSNDSYRKGYETHNVQNSRERAAGNDLQHLKWRDGKSGGHVYYDKPN